MHQNRLTIALMLRSLFFVSAKTRHIRHSLRFRSFSRLRLAKELKHSHYKCLSQSQADDDLEKGVERTETNNNVAENENKNSSTSCKQKVELSGKRLLLRACLCILGVLVFVGCSILTYYMGWYFGFPAYLAAFAAVLLATGKWRWLYVAVLTAPRDIR